MARLICWGGLFVCFMLSAFAQQTSGPPTAGQSDAQQQNPPVKLIPRSHEEREDSYRDEHRIILNVLVTGASGQSMTGLTENNFTLLDNQQPQEIASLRAVKGSAGVAPARIVFMLDAVNNSHKSLLFQAKEIERFLSRNPLDYATAIGILSGSGTTVGQPSQDRQTLAGEVDGLAQQARPFACDNSETADARVFGTGKFGAPVLPLSGPGSQEPDGLGCPIQRFQISVSALARFAQEQVNVPGRVILIWMGPGWPLLAGPGFKPDTTAIKQNFFDNRMEISTALRQAQITLDAVSFADPIALARFRSAGGNALFDGVSTEDQVTAGSLSLQALAYESGGRILMEGKDVASDIARCVADAESYYVLWFDSVSATKPGEYHSLQIKVNSPGVTVHTNADYYAQP
jgi:VWFA-related protein